MKDKKMTGNRINRRHFLRAGGATLLAGATLSGCDLLSTEPAQKADGSGVEGQRVKGKEAPMLAERVKNGELPPVEERLPKNPEILEPLESIGAYGGTWKAVVVGSGEIYSDLERTAGYDHLVRWKPEVETWTAEEVVPNVAESYEVNEDSTEYVFKLREGMKWSDGEPFTADDIVFWCKDVLTNEEITPSVFTWLQADGKPVVVEKLDDYRVVFRYSAPNSILIAKLATADGDGPTRHPAHYLKQFHKKYSSDVEQEARQQGFDSWADLFFQKSSPWDNAELPVLNAWKVTRAVGESTQRVAVERNPYYWKVDPDGSQLPYIDGISYDIASDGEVAKLQALNGDVDLIYRTIVLDLRDKPLFSRRQKSGGYRILDLVFEDSNTMAFCLNLSHENPMMRRVFGDLNFRVGLSHALNRNEMIDLLFVSQGEPHQVAPHPGTPYYNEKLARQYTAYDVDLANEYLDRVLPEKNAEGIRLGPDGEPFFFRVELASDARPQDVDAVELMQRYFKEVGVDMGIKSEAQELFFERTGANQHDSAVFGSGGGLDPILQPDFFLPFASVSFFSIPWTNWYLLGGMSGRIPENPGQPVEEPPAAARRQMELYDQLQATPGTEGQIDSMRQILQVAQEQFWCIGISLPAANFGIVSKTLHNVPSSMIDDHPWQTPGPTNPPQYFIEEEQF